MLKEHATHQEVLIYSFIFFLQDTHFYLVSEESLCTIERSLCAFYQVKLSLILQLID